MELDHIARGDNDERYKASAEESEDKDEMITTEGERSLGSRTGRPS